MNTESVSNNLIVFRLLFLLPSSEQLLLSQDMEDMVDMDMAMVDMVVIMDTHTMERERLSQLL